MQRIAIFLLLSAASAFGQAATPTFSPSAGTYPTTQNVTISCAGGTTPFYRIDGKQPVTIASIKYTSPISVSSTTTISAICATLGAYQTNLPAGGPEATCSTASGGTWGSLTCDASGGVGTVNPSNVTWTFGAQSAETVTAPASTASEVQILYKWLFGGNADPSAPTCDSCTEQVQDFTFTVTADSTIIANNEMDLPQYDNTHSINRQNGFQCNQQSGKFVIQVDSGNAGGWTDTIAPCNFAPGTTYEVVDAVSHVNGDTGCGGNGCANYLYIWLNGTKYTLNGNYGGTQGYSTQSGQKAWGRQDQIDLKPTGASSATGGRNILSSTVALGFGDESSTANSTYTISAGPPPTNARPILSGNTKLSGNAH